MVITCNEDLEILENQERQTTVSRYLAAQLNPGIPVAVMSIQLAKIRGLSVAENK